MKVVLFIFLLALKANAAVTTCEGAFTLRVSEQLSWLENENAQSIEVIREANAEVNSHVDHSENARILERLIRDEFVTSKLTASRKLKDGSVFRMTNLGIGKGQVLKLNDEIIFSNLLIARDGGAHIDTVRFSPDERYILINYEEKGSLDSFKILIYDLQTRKILGPAIETSEDKPIWVAATKFLATRYLSEINAGKLFEFDINGQVTERSQGFIKSRARDGAVVRSADYALQIVLSDGTRFAVKDADSFIASSGNKIFYTVKDTDGYGIRQGSLFDGALRNEKVLIAKTDWTIEAAQVADGYLSYRKSKGDQRIVVVQDLSSGAVNEIVLPNGVQGSFASWKTRGEILTLTLSSTIKEKEVVEYDLRTGFATDVEKLMYTADGIEYGTKVVEVKSKDGTLVPVRLTYRLPLVADGKAPSMIEVYGGFNKGGYFDPKYNVMTAFFVKNGGVLVHPAVRGGNEFGDKWHDAATGKNKTKTFEDIIATSDELSALGYFAQAKTMLTGASNGGMVVMATALKSPKSFGLVIPVNGVHDTFSKEDLDRRFDLGWSHEYGDSRKDDGTLDDYSPLENAGKAGPMPKVLIINGRNDSRVHPAHSRKLLQALRSQPGRDVMMYSLKNAGHWMNSLPYQDWIAWRSQVVMWSTIYDFVGIPLNAPAQKQVSDQLNERRVSK